MSVAQSLPIVDKFFIQECPLCGRDNRMVIKGVYHGDTREIYPDMGYSFCNCKDIFYTRFENIKNNVGIQSSYSLTGELLKSKVSLGHGHLLEIIMPDPYFIDWGQDPYAFLHWNPRTNHIIYNMDTFCDEAKELGFEVVSAEHDFTVGTETPQMMRIVLKV